MWLSDTEYVSCVYKYINVENIKYSFTLAIKSLYWQLVNRCDKGKVIREEIGSSRSHQPIRFSNGHFSYTSYVSNLCKVYIMLDVMALLHQPCYSIVYRLSCVQIRLGALMFNTDKLPNAKRLYHIVLSIFWSAWHVMEVPSNGGLVVVLE